MSDLSVRTCTWPYIARFLHVVQMTETCNVLKLNESHVVDWQVRPVYSNIVNIFITETYLNNFKLGHHDLDVIVSRICTVLENYLTKNLGFVLIVGIW
jgi:hypothetical protein